MSIGTAYIYDPERMLFSLKKRQGLSYEGVVSFAFHQEYPDEAPPGFVAASYFELDQNIAESDFLVAALSLIRCALEVEPDPVLEKSYRSTLRFLRWRRRIRRAGWLSRTFKPTIRLAIQDISNADEQVAEVLSDGTLGRIKVYKADLADTLFDIFTERLCVFPAEFATVPGIDPKPMTMEAFSYEALSSGVNHKLGTHQLRGVLID